ncbi:MAG: AMP-binding protein, partial [Bacteroidota bacterium]
MFNLSILLEESARRYPTKNAFVFANTHLTYAQINGAANQVAAGLRAAGIGAGDKVALSCLNVPYFPIVYYGILKAGGVVVPLSVLLKRDEITYHLEDSDAKAYFCFLGAPGLPMLEEGHAGYTKVAGCTSLYVITAKPEDPSPLGDFPTLGQLMHGQSPTNATARTDGDNTAVIIYTSGTTGRPKGAELSHQNLFLNAMVSAELFEPQAKDTLLTVLPLFHIFAMTVLMNVGLYRGCTNVLVPRFEAKAVFDLLEKHSVNFFAGVPTMYWGLLNYSGEDVNITGIAANLKCCISGGASLPVKVLEDFEAKFGVEILEGYGMSEGSPVVTFNQRKVGRKPGSIGTPVWGVEVKVIDAEGRELAAGEKGELVYRGHNVMKGYYNKPDANAETIVDGWLHSGDIATKDEDGFFYIVDRTKDMIIRGG